MMHFPGIESLLKENQFQREKNENFCLYLLQKTGKSPFNFHLRKKINKTDPPWNLKILGVAEAKKVEILKIEGSRAKFLFFGNKINLFFKNKQTIFFQGQNSKFRPDNALRNLFLLAKTYFLGKLDKSWRPKLIWHWRCHFQAFAL